MISREKIKTRVRGSKGFEGSRGKIFCFLITYIFQANIFQAKLCLFINENFRSISRMVKNLTADI
ncbi:MAG: hypothetical protein AMJ60_09785 [Desulfobacterales bacterium SG8_35]|nr:MAG: hypothetical protein AMJ60_09785 [Desulfobacterales bacterium SG8_35]